MRALLMACIILCAGGCNENHMSGLSYHGGCTVIEVLNVSNIVSILERDNTYELCTLQFTDRFERAVLRGSLILLEHHRLPVGMRRRYRNHCLLSSPPLPKRMFWCEGNCL